MKWLIPYAKIAAVVFGSLFAFWCVCEVFVVCVNPFLAETGIREKGTIPRLNVFVVDILNAGSNYSLWILWSLVAFAFFCWVVQKRNERSAWRRTALAVYLTPFVAVTVLIVAVCYL